MPVESRLVSGVCQVDKPYTIYALIKEHSQLLFTKPLFTFGPIRGKMIPAELESSIIAAEEKV